MPSVCQTLVTSRAVCRVLFAPAKCANKGNSGVGLSTCVLHTQSGSPVLFSVMNMK